MPNATNIPSIVQGNTFSLAIPLQIYAIEDNELVLHDYTPESGDDITIRLKGDRRNYTYKPSTNGNTAFAQLGGNELCGVYAIMVEIVKDDDTRLTSFRLQQLKIVASIDDLTATEIVDGVEQDVLYLDPEIFIAGKDGRGIVSIVKTATSGLVDTYTITYTDNTTSTFNVTNGKDGEDGAQGVGIADIAKTGTSGNVDTYTITMTDGTTYTFTVTNGAGGSQVQADWAQTDTTAVDFIKNKPIIDSAPTDNSPNLVTSGGVYTALSSKADKTELPLVVEMTNNNNVIICDTSVTDIYTAYSAGRGVFAHFDGGQAPLLMCGQSMVVFSWFDDTTENFVIGSTSNNTDTWMMTSIELQEALVSGTNIKTINNTSLLGSGDIAMPTKTSDLTNDSNFASIPFVTIDSRHTTFNTYDTICGNGNDVPLTSGQLLLVYINTAMIAGDYQLYLNLDQAHSYQVTSNKAVNNLTTTSGQSAVKCKDYPQYSRLLLQYNGSMWVVVASGTAPIDISTKQDTLVSGTNIKSINSASILGSGNLDLLTPNFCPIIEDTRSSAVAAITGVAPFASLVDGQRIMLKVAQNIPNNPTLTLTLSGGSATSAIPMYTNYKSTPLTTGWNNNIRAGSYIELVYESTDNRWIMVGQKDSDTTYPAISQSNINQGTNTNNGVITSKLFHDNAYIVEETYSSGSLKANKFYDFGTVSSALTIPTLDATDDLVSNALNIYALRFIAGADNISITFPTGVEVDDTPTINTGDYVEIMINLYVENNTNHFYASIKVWQAQ